MNISTCFSNINPEARLIYAAFMKNLASNEPEAVKMRDTFRSSNGKAEIMKALSLLNLPSATEMSEQIAEFMKSHLDNNSAMEEIAANLKKDALAVAGNCGTSPIVSIGADAVSKTTTNDCSQKPQDSGQVGERFMSRFKLLPGLADAPLTGFADPRLNDPKCLLKKGWKHHKSEVEEIFELKGNGYASDSNLQQYRINCDGSKKINTALEILRSSGGGSVREYITKKPSGEISRDFNDCTLEPPVGVGVICATFPASDKDAYERVDRALAKHEPIGYANAIREIMTPKPSYGSNSDSHTCYEILEGGAKWPDTI